MAYGMIDDSAGTPPANIKAVNKAFTEKALDTMCKAGFKRSKE